ncbi:hypothetical protein C8J57DRAFT_1250026 [Mycena rebaudengoi]|nr:hypothetical protein C8J57DRAFT_1250026 [Mycena rebaudengoi]
MPESMGNVYRGHHCVFPRKGDWVVYCICAEHKHTIVDSDYEELHSRYLQMDESIQNSLRPLKQNLKTGMHKFDNLQLMHNIPQIHYQTALQHLQSSKNTSKAQVEELKPQRTLLDDHHLNHKALQTEHQITLQTLKYSLYLNVLLISAEKKKSWIVGEQNSLMGDRETEDGSDNLNIAGSDSDTGSQSQSIVRETHRH